MMDRALGAIVSSSTAPTGNIEAVNRFGMHYQWGRKDPFTPTTITKEDIRTEVQLYTATGGVIKSSSNGIGGEFTYEDRSLLTTITPTTINHLIENPSTHYAKGDKTNWVPIASAEEYNNTTKEGDWWNPTIKTLYDPCPNGYRIPGKNTYGNAGDKVNDLTGWLAFSVDGLSSGRIWDITSSFFPASGLRNFSSGQFWGGSTNGYSWVSTPYNPTVGYSLEFHSSAVYPNTYLNRAFGFPVRCILD